MDVVCNPQFAISALLFQSLLLQLLFALSKKANHEQEDTYCEHGKEQKAESQPHKRGINFVVVTDYSQLPMRFPLHVCIEDGAVSAVCVEVYDSASAALALFAGYCAVVDEVYDKVWHLLLNLVFRRSDDGLPAFREQEEEG